MPAVPSEDVTGTDSAAAAGVLSVEVFLFLVVAAGPKFSSESSLVSEKSRFLAAERFGVLNGRAKDMRDAGILATLITMNKVTQFKIRSNVK